jgi:drug/metabolite transporter (DMT)-like permease
MPLQTLGIIAAMGSAAAWAVGTVLLKLVKGDIPALGMTLITGLLGSLLMGSYLVMTGGQAMAWNTFLVLGLSGLVGISLGDTFFFEALGRLDAHILVLLMVLGQVATVFLAMGFLNETVTASQWASILLIVAGVGLALLPGKDEAHRPSTRAGILYGLLAVLCMSGSIVAAKSALDSVSAAEATFVRMAWGASGVVLFGLLGRRLKGWLAPFASIVVAAKVSLAVLVGTFGGFLLFHIALKNVGVAIANPIGATEPIFAAAFSALILREHISRRALIGALLAVVGTVLMYQSTMG